MILIKLGNGPASTFSHSIGLNANTWLFHAEKLYLPHLHHFCLKAILWNGWKCSSIWMYYHVIFLEGSICSRARTGFAEWKIHKATDSVNSTVWCEERLPRVYNNVDSVTRNRTFELRTLTQVEFLSFLAKCNRVRSSGSRFLGPWSSAPGSSVFSLPLHSGIGYGWDLALITSYIKCIIICCIVLL